METLPSALSLSLKQKKSVLDCSETPKKIKMKKKDQRARFSEAGTPEKALVLKIQRLLLEIMEDLVRLGEEFSKWDGSVKLLHVAPTPKKRLSEAKLTRIKLHVSASFTSKTKTPVLKFFDESHLKEELANSIACAFEDLWKDEKHEDDATWTEFLVSDSNNVHKVLEYLQTFGFVIIRHSGFFPMEMKHKIVDLGVEKGWFRDTKPDLIYPI